MHLYDIALQNMTRAKNLPKRAQFRKWVAAALKGRCKKTEVLIRIVNKSESAQLNQNYRKRTGPTNILSFSFEAPIPLEIPFLGDLVVCAPLVAKEAKAQGKTLEAHWAHLIIHGTLHLLGHDHIKKRDAVLMEKMEINILAELGYSDPYKG